MQDVCAWGAPCCKVTEGPGRQQAEHEPAESHSSSKGKSAPGLHLQEHHWKYRDMIILQYSVLLRLHPESCVQVWSPQLRKDADRLEKVHRSVTKMIKRAEESAVRGKTEGVRSFIC